MRSSLQKFVTRGVALAEIPSPRASIVEEWSRRSFPDFLRLLMRIECDTRTAWLNKFKSLYWRQILLSGTTSAGKGLVIGPQRIRVFRGGGGRLDIGNDVTIYTPCDFVVASHIFPEAVIEIGDGTRIGMNCSFRAAKEVRIGSGCLIAPWVRIFDYNAHPLEPQDGRIGKPTPPTEVTPVRIGDNVWIGENAFIQRGTTIGNHSIVAANSVVGKNVPEKTVVMGNPARVALWLDKQKGKDVKE